jgi:quinol monooxygenase YgiN
MKVSMPPLQASDKSAISSLGELVELRRYRLHPGTREKLITLFDQEFVESQEDEGMRVIGQFRDLDDPDCFVWLRGFADMKARQRALSAFYTGPVWTAHRDAANGTMINSDNILLLRASAPGRGFAPATETRPSGTASASPPGLITATICSLAPGSDHDFATLFETAVRPALERADAGIRASFIIERSVNSFPRLPVREGENVFVWFASFANAQTHAAHLETLSRSQAWTRDILPEIDKRLWRKPEVARLEPTSRSLLHG